MRRSLLFLIATTFVVSGCGGGDDTDTAETAAIDPDDADAAGEITEDASASDGSATDESMDGDEASDAAAPAVDGVEHPVVRFAAHGPADPNTYGPSCAMGIETTALNVTRMTAPSSWSYGGSSGGTGASSIEFRVEDGSITVDVAAAEFDRSLVGTIVAGAEVARVDLDGTSVPIVEVTVDDRPGYAIDQLVWMEPLPPLFDGAMAMTVTVTGNAPDLFTLDEAVELLGTVRVERCEAVMTAVTAMGAVPVLAVPEFDPDPLGKTYPGGDQPAFDMQNIVGAYSTEQLAYLLPFENPVATCVAGSLQAEVPDPFLLDLGVLAAVEGEQQDALQAIADAC